MDEISDGRFFGEQALNEPDLAWGVAFRTAETTATTSSDGATAEPVLIPMTEVKPEDVGTLSLRYVDGVPQLVVSGGTVLPAALTVVDGSGNAVAAYTAGPTTTISRSARGVSVTASGEINAWGSTPSASLPTTIELGTGTD